MPTRGAVDSPAERTRTRQKNRIQTNDAPLESCMMAPCALHPADTAAPGSGMNARPTANVAASTRLNAASVRTMAYCSERGPMAKRGSSSMKPDASSDRLPVMVAPAWIQAESLSESIGPRVDRAHCRLSRTAQGQLTGGPLLQMKSPLANERAACERRPSRCRKATRKLLDTCSWVARLRGLQMRVLKFIYRPTAVHLSSRVLHRKSRIALLAARCSGRS